MGRRAQFFSLYVDFMMAWLADHSDASSHRLSVRNSSDFREMREMNGCHHKQ
jgi:hypothetical protein